MRRGRSAPQIVVLAAVVGSVSACGGGAAADPGASTASDAPPAVGRTLMARGIELQPARVTAPAGTDILIAFDNTDPGVPHGLVLYRDAAHVIAIGSAPVVVGPVRQTLRIAGLAPGRYEFSCVVHPMMVADLVIAS